MSSYEIEDHLLYQRMHDVGPRLCSNKLMKTGRGGNWYRVKREKREQLYC